MFSQACQEFCPQGRGVHPLGRHLPRQTPTPPRQTATAVDSMHPTRMYSCYHLQTKLWEGNVFTGVCLYWGGGECQVVHILLECFLVNIHNEVAKVMFLQACLSTGGGACSRGGGCLLLGGGVSAPEGVCSRGGGVCSALRQASPGEMAIAADGMHPTGMHSCLVLF